MTEPIIMVAGFGRCGTSLMMQMLSAAGVPTTGEWPAFEDNHTSAGNVDHDWYVKQHGKAVKILDPLHTKRWRRVPHKIIWLERNHMEQAKSQSKFLYFTMGVQPTGKMIMAFAKSYKKERAKTLRLLNFLNGAPVKIIKFEDIINNPIHETQEIAKYLNLAPESREIMTRCVLPRSPICSTGMDIEVELISQEAG